MPHSTTQHTTASFTACSSHCRGVWVPHALQRLPALSHQPSTHSCQRSNSEKECAFFAAALMKRGCFSGASGALPEIGRTKLLQRAQKSKRVVAAGGQQGSKEEKKAIALKLQRHPRGLHRQITAQECAKPGLSELAPARKLITAQCRPPSAGG